jgi:hypothetical protein
MVHILSFIGDNFFTKRLNGDNKGRFSAVSGEFVRCGFLLFFRADAGLHHLMQTL